MEAYAEDLAALADWFIQSVPRPSETDAALGRILHRELLYGEPVELGRLADLADLPAAAVEGFVRDWTHRDDAGLIYAFFGLSLRKTRHRIMIRGRPFYSWCAWDTLFLPELLNETVEIASTCPVTGAPIRIGASRSGIDFEHPAGVAVSFVTPTDLCCDPAQCAVDVDPEDLKRRGISEFCDLVNYFSSRDAAMEWAEGRAHTHILSVAEAFEVGRLTNRSLFGEP